jgi:hypothetical protein
MKEKYSDLIWEAAIYSGVSPYHLASRIKQEVGPFITHNSISGTVSGYEGLYNFYNIGATSSTETLGAIKNGLQFAKDGKGASEDTKANLLLPWDNPRNAIKGGAVFIGSSYILVGQNNLYLQKFDVNDERGSSLFWHQYMTNCLAPYSESNGIYKAYESNGMLNSSIRFIIPVYENMPQYTTDSPNIVESDYVVDNTKMYADVTGTLNVRTGPSTSYEVITGVTKNDVITRLKKGVQNGERWDKVELENGIVGYVFQSYLKEVEIPVVTNIELSIDNNTIQKGSINSIKISITPQDANEKIVWESSDDSILSVEEGIITANAPGIAIITAKTEDGRISDSIIITVIDVINNEENEDNNENEDEDEEDNKIKIEFDSSLRVEQNEISNLNIDELNVNKIEQLIKTDLNIEFYNSKNEKLEDEDKIGTGTTLVLKNENNEKIKEYTFILYGDVNGDGEIDSLDTLILQKHILETKKITGIFLKAANTSKNGEEPSSLDVLKMQKHILEIKYIEQ